MKYLLASLLVCSQLFSAPPALTVSPPTPKPGDVVIVNGPNNTTFDVRGASEVTRHGTKSIVLTMPDKGVVIVLGAAGKTAAPTDVAVIILGSGAVSPLPPGPSPTPTPTPEATFSDLVKQAYKADGATKEQISKYAALYRAAATITVFDPSIKTSGDLLGEMQRAVKALGLPPGCLDKTARAVGNELNKTLATPVALDTDPATRKNVSDAFTRVATTLEGAANGK